MRTHLRKRSMAATAGLFFIAASIGVMASPVLGQVAEPQIAFLNPSSFATAGERGIIVSDAKPDAGPGCCGSALARYRLNAWVGNAPPDAHVFFAVTQRTTDIEIAATHQVPMNTWEANWSIPPTILDGPATLYAYLVSGDEPIAVDKQDVTIMRLQENVQLTYPWAGGQFGSYTPLASAMEAGKPSTRKNPIGVVDALYTETPEMSQVRAFYTTSEPGSDPKWTACGTELVGTSDSRTGNGVRCTLADPAHQEAVTAVAAVSNESPDDYEARFNQSGDAVSVAEPYAQELTNFGFVTAGYQTVAREPKSERFFCSEPTVVQLTDQMGRGIAGASADVHATGPTDSLKFDTFAILTINQPPDRGAHAEEEAFDCTGGSTAEPMRPPGNLNPDLQGEHQRFGFPDRKHIETLPRGTSDTGTFSFRLHDTSTGITEYTVWIDELDDGCTVNNDQFNEGEMNLSGGIGWGQDPAVANPQPFEQFVPCVPEGGTAEPEFDGNRTITARITTDPIVSGEPGTFTGRISAADPACADDERVVLKQRRRGGNWVAKTSGRTRETERYRMTTRVVSGREYRVVAPAAAGCLRVRSKVIRL